MNLRYVQKLVGEWATRNFPTEKRITSLRCTLGVSEETGELAHAILKRDQGIRGTEEEHIAAAKDAIGDIAVYIMHLCHVEGWDLEAIICETAEHVTRRDWVADPERGGVAATDVTPEEWKETMCDD